MEGKIEEGVVVGEQVWRRQRRVSREGIPWAVLDRFPWSSPHTLFTGRTQNNDPHELYRRAGELAGKGEYAQARQLYQSLCQSPANPAFHALLLNDLAVLEVMEGHLPVPPQQSPPTRGATGAVSPVSLSAESV